MNRLPNLMTAMLFATAAVLLAGANWPQFRGPQASGVVEGDSFPHEWDAETNIRWKFENPGEGWSCPVVWGDKVFLTAAVEKQAPQEPEQDEEQPAGGPGRRFGRQTDMTTAVYSWEVYCLDAATGELLWKQVAREGHPRISKHSLNTFASETPVTDGEHLYAYFGMHGLYCFDMEGNPVWQKDLGVYPLLRDWGSSSSPVLGDGKLFVQVDNEELSFLVALDAASGDELWRVERDEPTQYSTPLLWQTSARTELVVGGQVCRSYDPASGELLWSLDMSRGRSVASPLAVGDVLLVGNEQRRQGGPDEGGGSLFAVRADASGDITPAGSETTSEGVIWSCDESGIAMASPVVCQGRIYVLERRSGVLRCVSFETGEILYTERIPGAQAFWASPWTDGERVYCLDDDGTTHVIAPGDELEIVDENSLPGQFWSTPAVADGALLVRSTDALYCIAP